MPVTPETCSVLRVLIASPSDQKAQRNTTQRTIYEWNALHSTKQQTVLVPLMWEYNAVPQTGSGDAQQVINRGLVDQSHIVITLFGHRIGSHTPRAISGTAEEVQRAIDQGSPTHVLFNRGPIPAGVDTKQLNALRRYEAALRPIGLSGEFRNNSELASLVMRCLVEDVGRLVGGPVSARTSPNGAVLRASLTGNHLNNVHIANEGDVEAEGLKVDVFDDATDVRLDFYNGANRVSLSPGSGYLYHGTKQLTTRLRLRLAWKEGRASKESTLFLEPR